VKVAHNTMHNEVTLLTHSLTTHHSPGWGGARRLVDIVGRQEALKLLALGEAIKVDEATGGAARVLRNGLGDNVVVNNQDDNVDYVVNAAIHLLR
jgi:enoyl-CoA hydratase/carnithine racemase